MTLLSPKIPLGSRYWTAIGRGPVKEVIFLLDPELRSTGSSAPKTIVSFILPAHIKRVYSEPETRRCNEFPLTHSFTLLLHAGCH
jgi:hypothetical protein